MLVKLINFKRDENDEFITSNDTKTIGGELKFVHKPLIKSIRFIESDNIMVEDNNSSKINVFHQEGSFNSNYSADIVIADGIRYKGNDVTKRNLDVSFFE
jgi:hypothetical protein